MSANGLTYTYLGFKPGTSASLFDVTAGGAALATQNVDVAGKVTFTLASKPPAGNAIVIDGTARVSAGKVLAAPPVTRPVYTQPDKFYFASNRLRTPTARAIPTASREFMCSHMDLGVAPYATNDYVIALPAHYTSAVPTDNEFAATNAFNVEGVSIGYGATPGTATWFTAVSVADAALGVPGGQAGITLDPATNSVGALYRAVAAAIPAGVRRYARVAFNVAAGGYVPSGIEVNTTLGEGQVGQATSAAAFLTSGTVNTSGRLGGTLYGASWVACKGHDGRPVPMALGDSIFYGQNETGNAFPAGGGGGVFSRAMLDTASSAMFLGTNMAVPGTGPSDIAVNGRSKTARKFDLIAKGTTLNGGVPMFTQLCVNHLTNSLGPSYNTLATVVPMIKAYVGVLNTEWPGIPVAYQLAIPKATTNNGFQDLGGQTVGSNDASAGVRWQFNDKLLADKLDGAVQWAVNAPQYVSAPTARDKWDIQVPTTAVSAADTAAGGLHYFFADATWLQPGDFISANPDTGGSGANGSGASVLSIDTTVTPHDVLVNTTLGAQVAGTKYSRHLASDSAGLHPGSAANVRMVPAWTAWKNSLWAA
ncbi:hypothetical protein ASF41_22080 [Methylobacterium sp. Leaf111]|nr:hypothetical protein ASF41_22080 [Methylobacterium sp. Leaf111]